MALTLKAGELLNINDSLMSMSQETMPIRAAYWVARAMKLIEPEVRVIEEQRSKLIQKHGEPDSDQNVRVQRDKMPVFITELSEVLEQSITLSADIPKIRLETFGTGNFKPQHFAALSVLIEE